MLITTPGCRLKCCAPMLLKQPQLLKAPAKNKRHNRKCWNKRRNSKDVGTKGISRGALHAPAKRGPIEHDRSSTRSQATRRASERTFAWCDGHVLERAWYQFNSIARSL